MLLCISEHSHVHKRDGHGAENLQPTVYVQYLAFEYVNTQHITMYSAFILAAIVQILAYHNFKVPQKLPYALGIMAFFIEGFLFANHLHSRFPLDIHVHVLLVYSIWGCVIFSVLETYRPNEVIFAYGRILFTILQGKQFLSSLSVGFGMGVIHCPSFLSFKRQLESNTDI